MPTSTSPGSTPSVTHIFTRHFTTAEILTLFTDSPITLVTNPGSHKALVPVSAFWDYKFGTHPYFSSSSSSTIAELQVGGVAFATTQGTTVFNGVLLADAVTFGSPAILGQSASAFTFCQYTRASATSPDAAITRALGENAPLVLVATGGNLTNGAVVTTSINAAGSGYAPGDTVADDSSWGAGDFLVTVNTVDGGGAVLTYTVTSVGTAGWHVTPPSNASSVIVFTNVAPQSGVGTGFQLNVTGIAQGNGTMDLTITYGIFTLA